jgi:hypothetical protein
MDKLRRGGVIERFIFGEKIPLLDRLPSIAVGGRLLPGKDVWTELYRINDMHERLEEELLKRGELERQRQENRSLEMELDKELGENVAQRQETSRELVDATEPVRKRGMVLWTSRFAKSTWPYVLAILLGLKLARHNYVATIYEPTPVRRAKEWVLAVLGFARAWLWFQLRSLVSSLRSWCGRWKGWSWARARAGSGVGHQQRR